MTPDDLFRRPDGDKGYELVRGELRERVKSAKASYIAGNVLSELHDVAARGWLFGPGVAYRCFPADPDQVCRASVTYLTRDRLSAEDVRTAECLRVPPDLVVEVVSANDRAVEVDIRIEEWLTAGVRLLWRVGPDARIVDVYAADGASRRLRETDTLTGNGLLPGLAIPVANLFRTPAST